MADKIRVTVWGENAHEKVTAETQKLYPDGMHTYIANFLNTQDDIDARTSVLDEPEHGLTEEVLAGTEHPLPHRGDPVIVPALLLRAFPWAVVCQVEGEDARDRRCRPVLARDPQLQAGLLLLGPAGRGLLIGVAQREPTRRHAVEADLRMEDPVDVLIHPYPATVAADRVTPVLLFHETSTRSRRGFRGRSPRRSRIRLFVLTFSSLPPRINARSLEGLY
ncbi:hypothetical protein LCGC14_0284630, partial [marine sediment metagenome]